MCHCLKAAVDYFRIWLAAWRAAAKQCSLERIHLGCSGIEKLAGILARKKPS
jgi:hypothetical protein